MQLVSTTVSQLNEMEKLVGQTEKYTRQMQQYNELAQDKYFQATRILGWAERVVELSHDRPKDLEEMNSLIRNLKFEMSNLQTLLRQHQESAFQNKMLENKTLSIEQEGTLEKEMLVASGQLERTAEQGTHQKSDRLTAQNTALINNHIVHLRKTQNQILNRLAERNKWEAIKDSRNAEKERLEEEFWGKSGQRH